MHEHRKFIEAEYFYNRMVCKISDYDAFTFNFSAFLSATRSIILYALEEARAKPGGQGWYDTNVSTKQFIKFFKDVRNLNIHVQPLKPSKSVTILLSGTITSTGTLNLTKFDAKGNVVEQRTSESQDQIVPLQNHKPEIEHYYTLREWKGEEDILSLSRQYLNEIWLMIEEGIKKGYISG